MSDEMDVLMKRLRLANSRRVWRDLCRRAEEERWSYEMLLSMLLAEEVAHRANTRVGRLTRWAEFPFLKTIDEFNFTFQSTLRQQAMGSFLSPDFVTEGRNLILSGKPGRGKTHLAIAIAHKAIQNGFDAFFTSCAALIDELSGAASHKGRFREALLKYTKPDVLVIDEVGYLTYGNDAANVLFHVVNDRHVERRPIIFTTNKSPKVWGRVLHDEDLAEVIVDRVLERGRHLKLDGPSFRTNNHPDLDRAGTTSEDSAIISGTARPDFPEPTTILEFGSGLSTLCLAQLLLDSAGDQARLVSIEQDEDHAKTTNVRLAKLGLSSVATCLHAPLHPVTCLGITTVGYDLDLDAVRCLHAAPFEAVMIDGPAAQSGARVSTLPAVMPLLALHAHVFLDDALRDGEIDAIAAWLRAGLLADARIRWTAKGMMRGRARTS